MSPGWRQGARVCVLSRNPRVGPALPPLSALGYADGPMAALPSRVIFPWTRHAEGREWRFLPGLKVRVWSPQLR
jgi:hypothetical protein